jgi:hypothetical protein
VLGSIAADPIVARRWRVPPSRFRCVEPDSKLSGGQVKRPGGRAHPLRQGSRLAARFQLRPVPPYYLFSSPLAKDFRDGPWDGPTRKGWRPP